MITIAEICRFGDTNPSKNNYIGAERIVKTTNNLFFVGKTVHSDGTTLINAKCISVSNLRGKTPLNINGKIDSNFKILEMQCTCTAGAGEKCKHIIATLIYCYK